MHLPQEQHRIELFGLRIAKGPPYAPRAQSIDDALEIVPGRSQVVLADVRPRARLALVRYRS